ncbi:MAG: hypothetical protein ACT4PV_02440 [Planctomycetaceae bacterium]
MRSRLRATLLLLLLGALLLEAVVWLRMPMVELLQRAYPQVGLDHDGKILFFEIERRDRRVRVVRILDSRRRLLESFDLDPERTLATRVATHAARFHQRPNRWFENPLFLPRARTPHPQGPATPSPLEILAADTLNYYEEVRRGIRSHANRSRIVLLDDRPPLLPIRWAVENDRLVCRETATGHVVAGFGPGGYTRGEGGGEGAGFGPLATDPILLAPDSRNALGILLLGREEERVIHLSIAEEQRADGGTPADSPEPLLLEIESRPLRAIEPGAPVSGEVTYAALRNDGLLFFRADGAVPARVELSPGERILAIHGASSVGREGLRDAPYATPRAAPATPAPIVLHTLLEPTHPAGERMRLRLLRPGEPAVTHEVLLEPARAGEQMLANLAASLALLRPAPLALASSLSPLPENASELLWWRDPWLSGGRFTGWLLASLALAAACAWRARRTARERCSTTRRARLWTAAVLLLGPLGLLWMRFVLPRVPVAAVGGARRAVDLDASPSSAAPWPDPQPLGIEVIS